MVTLPLEDMPARVGASLCHGIGCPEMIAGTDQQYVEMAIALATGPLDPSGEASLPPHLQLRFGST
jgi:predicted O-linked N-acetylglucosamine transferase (SPINDLY family)